jgi:hypothetical protein
MLGWNQGCIESVETGSSPVTAVTAERDLTELFTNYTDFVGNGSNGTIHLSW